MYITSYYNVYICVCTISLCTILFLYSTLSNWDLEFDRWAPTVIRVMWKVK